MSTEKIEQIITPILADLANIHRELFISIEELLYIKSANQVDLKRKSINTSASIMVKATKEAFEMALNILGEEDQSEVDDIKFRSHIEETDRVTRPLLEATMACNNMQKEMKKSSKK